MNMIRPWTAVGRVEAVEVVREVPLTRFHRLSGDPLLRDERSLLRR